MERDGLSGFELVVLVVGGLAGVAVGTVWLGAVLALAVSGQAVRVSFSEAAGAVSGLPGQLGSPSSAWPSPTAGRLPGPVVYWACTLVAAVIIGVLVAAVVWLVRGLRVGTAPRSPLGVPGRAAFARVRDLRPVLVRGPVPGRFIVGRFGRLGRFSRWLVATETPRQEDSAGERSRCWYLLRRAHPRRGGRGAVALVGPSQSGKTTAAVSGILEWDGPAVLSSVKADLLGATVGWRSGQGDVRVYDPVRTLGSTGVGQASWSPVRPAGTVAGAQRAARALTNVAPRGGVEGGIDFWLSLAEILLSGLLYVAHHTGRDMGTVCEWVLLQDRPNELGPGEVRTHLDLVRHHVDEEVALGAVEASRSLIAIWNMEDRTRSSVYATAQTLVWPWSEPEVAASSRGASVDLDWLLAGDNTVYLCSPIEDQQRLAPAFGGMLSDLIAQVYRRTARTGRALNPALLLVVDEAGNTPMKALPQYASTLSGLGVVLVTVWQSLAQMEVSYGKDADTLLTNHPTKVLYSGLSDPASLRYVATVMGDTEVETRSRSAGEQLGRGSTQLATTNVPMAPAHALRQMRPGDALLLHGTLPPAHVRTRPFYAERSLAERAAMSPAAAAAAAVPSGETYTPVGGSVGVAGDAGGRAGVLGVGATSEVQP